MKNYLFSILIICILNPYMCVRLLAQTDNIENRKLWHDEARSIRYIPDGEDFVITNGNGRFNRALYGTNTAYRIEAGDLPEFAQYLPGMGGNMKFGIIVEDSGKWLIHADEIIARYKPGSMLYEISDALIGNCKMYVSVIAMDDAEGMIVKVKFNNVDKTFKLFWAFGGVSGTKFRRNGDIGADPVSGFYLKPEYCVTNIFDIRDNTFTVYYGSADNLSEKEKKISKGLKDVAKRKKMKQLAGIFPPFSAAGISDANMQDSPLAFLNSQQSQNPAITGAFEVKDDNDIYFAIYNPETIKSLNYEILPAEFRNSEEARKKLAGRVKVNTPDPYINTIGGALSIAADAIWQHPTYLHGSVAWRIRLNGWRGAYVADPLGWHDRAKTHLLSYSQSQVISPPNGPVIPDYSRNIARQKEQMGTSMFSRGYICRDPNGKMRPHHYDMNLVFIDQMLQHYHWTGDLDFVKQTWPVLKRHLEWEKRNFDADGDGLYDAYCCIWASDALQYSGGGVTHSSAYNYKANKIAGDIAVIMGEDPQTYLGEADKILKAINSQLWIPELGIFAEYKDFSGLQQIHPSAGLWTVYHAIDSDVPDIFQAYQALQFVDNEIPHIPVIAEGMPDGNYYTLSTTNWMPYAWSINNVALSELLHTSLAYWQTGRTEDAFMLWKSSLLESMFLGASPGNFQQLSFYDAMRGELYRDFADPVGMAARTLVEGLFGIIPDALNDTLTICPGFPASWNYASIKVPDISFSYKREGNKETYTITPEFPESMKLKFRAKALSYSVNTVKVDGKEVLWKNIENAIEYPLIEIICDESTKYEIEIEWEGKEFEKIQTVSLVAKNDTLKVQAPRASLLEIYDPQKVLADAKIKDNILAAVVAGKTGDHTVFARVKRGMFTWWAPVNFGIIDSIEIVSTGRQDKNTIQFKLKNHKQIVVKGKVIVNPGINAFEKDVEIPPDSCSEMIVIQAAHLKRGSNLIIFKGQNDSEIEGSVINWDINNQHNPEYETVDLGFHFNDKVTQIFKNRYMSPRSTYPTLQLPWQGIGNWCYPLIEPDIDDSGLRNLAGDKDMIYLLQEIPLATPGRTDKDNIVFVSQWDNYPGEVAIPLSGNASHAYFMMAGSTNPMQSRFTNGEVIVEYEDGSGELLALNNPETWWPIEQDYYTDGFAFSIGYPEPLRVHLKTGFITRDLNDYISIKGYTERAIDGGAATILDLPLNPDKTLKSLKIKALANDVVIGLMSVTLQREE